MTIDDTTPNDRLICVWNGVVLSVGANEPKNWFFTPLTDEALPDSPVIIEPKPE